MKVINVIPITRSIFSLEGLSYFSTKNVSRGDLVKINLRGKETFAIVEKASEVTEKKAELKKSGFKLKPITAVVKENFFSEKWFEILENISQNYVIPKPAILYSIIPKAILSREIQKSDFEPEARTARKFAIKGSLEERVQFIRTITREHFARKKSLLVLCPRIDSVEKIKHMLKKGIEVAVVTRSEHDRASEFFREKMVCEQFGVGGQVKGFV